VKEKPTVGSPFIGAFHSDCIPKVTKDVNVQLFINSFTFRDELIMDNALPALPFLYSHQLKIFCFKVVVTISLRRLLFCLWIIQEAPCFIPCDYVKGFVVFYQPYRRGHQKCSFVFIFAWASAFKLPTMTKKEHVQYIMKNTMTTSDRNSNL